MYRVVIIDDEKRTVEIITQLLADNCHDMAVVGTAKNVEEGVELVNTVHPDIVLLDVNMPDGTGFDLLNKLEKRDFSLVFITAHDEYAIKAFKFSAIDYLLKPVVTDEFIVAMKKARDAQLYAQKQLSFQNLLATVAGTQKKINKIVLKTASDIFLVQIQDILYCKSEGSYTKFHLKGNKSLLVSKNLKEFESLLAEHRFFRVHHTHLINLNYIERFHRKDGGYVIMNDQTKIPVSVRKKEKLLSELSAI